MKVTLKQLEILQAVVLAGNISKSSSLLGLAQPTISQQLAKMEESLGVVLVRRERTKNLELTLAGEFWFRTAKGVLQSIQEAEATHCLQFWPKENGFAVWNHTNFKGTFVTRDFGNCNKSSAIL